MAAGSGIGGWGHLLFRGYSERRVGGKDLMIWINVPQDVRGRRDALK